MTRSLSLCFAAGAVGALVNSIALWALGHFGVTAQLGVHIAPALTAHWLYPRLVWGGLWALLALLPLRGNAVLLGMVLSLPPTLFQLLWVFPYLTGHGWLGLQLGVLTPALVAAMNLVWAWSTLGWLYLTGR